MDRNKGERTVMFSAVIFDLDGTLLDTLSDIGDAANRVLDALGYSQHRLDDYRQFVGSGVRMLFARALPEGAADEATVTRCAERFQVEYARHWNVATRPYEGVAEMLDRVLQRGVKMAVLSNKPDDFTRRCVQYYLAAWPLAPVLGQREGIARKPDPAGVLEILDHWQIPAQQCLYLGDSDIDMQTATAAGVLPIGATWGFRTADELIRSGARHLIHQPTELTALVDRLTEGS
jgi:phosphoglycolate phosphatase